MWDAPQEPAVRAAVPEAFRRAPTASHRGAVDRRGAEAVAELLVVAREHQRVDRHLARLSMRAKLESIFEQILQHEIQRANRRPRAGPGDIFFGLGDDVVPGGLGPVGSADNLGSLQRRTPGESDPTTED